MAITREEIKAIADAVAEKVVTPQLVCACGYNALNEAYNGADFRDEIYAKRLPGVERELPGFLSTVSDVEISCHVTLDEAKDSAREAAKDAREGNWEAAQINASAAETDVLLTLKEKATKG